jgi:hypothetical protein
LEEVLARDCCWLMSIDWSTWLVLLAAGIVAFIIKVGTGAVRSPDLYRRLAGPPAGGLEMPMYRDEGQLTSYILTMLLLLGGCLIFHIVVLVVLHSKYKKMIAALKSGNAKEVAVVGEKYACRALWALQINLLFTCFIFGFYLPHTRYVVTGETTDLAGLWHALSVVIFALNIFLLPVSLPRVTMVDAFYSLDPEALETVNKRLKQVDVDLEYLYEMWAAKGKPSLDTDGDGKITIGEFKAVLKKCSLHVSGKTAGRMFDAVDADSSGSIDMKELKTKLDQMELGLKAKKAAMEGGAGAVA